MFVGSKSVDLGSSRVTAQVCCCTFDLNGFAQKRQAKTAVAAGPAALAQGPVGWFDQGSFMANLPDFLNFVRMATSDVTPSLFGQEFSCGRGDIGTAEVTLPLNCISFGNKTTRLA